MLWVGVYRPINVFIKSIRLTLSIILKFLYYYLGQIRQIKSKINVMER